MKRAFIFAMTAALCAVVCAGCGEPERPRPPLLPETTRPASVPKPPPVPGVNGESGGTDVLLVKPVGRDRSKDGYRCEDQAPQGALRIICRLPFKKVTLPAVKHVDFTGGSAIKNPKTVTPYKVIYASYTQAGYDIKNELDYYKNWNPPVVESPLHWLKYQGGSPSVWAVSGVAIIVQGVKAGVREELVRGSASTAHIRSGRTLSGRIAGGRNYSGFNIAFLPCNEKVMLSSHDHFPCEITVASLESGQPLGKVTSVPAYNFPPEGKQGAYGMWGSFGGWWMPGEYRPRFVGSPTLRKTGPYRMRCRRHPWQIGYAIVVDNPYVAVSGAQKSGWPSADGKVSIAGIPPGTWTVRLWHPRIKPVEEVHEIKITRDETTHLVVDFQLPDQLK
jgi:hypothetical protein